MMNTATHTSLETFCDAVRVRLVGALTLTTGDRAIAEELAQEALVRTWQHWSTVQAMESPEAWTFRVAFNLAGSWRRRRAAERRANRRTGVQPEPVNDLDRSAVLAVRDAVAALPSKQRAIVIARFYLGCSVRETAELVGSAEGTVKATTHQAIGNLRRAGLTFATAEEEVPSR